MSLSQTAFKSFYNPYYVLNRNSHMDSDSIKITAQVISPRFRGYIDPEIEMNLTLDSKWIGKGCFQQFHLGIYYLFLENFNSERCIKIKNNYEACYTKEKESFYISPKIKLTEPYKCKEEQGCKLYPKKRAEIKTSEPQIRELKKYKLDWNDLVIPSVKTYLKIGCEITFLPKISANVTKGSNSVLWYKYIAWHTEGTIHIKDRDGNIVISKLVEVSFPILIHDYIVDGLYGLN